MQKRQLHVVCTCKVVVLLIKPIFFFDVLVAVALLDLKVYILFRIASFPFLYNNCIRREFRLLTIIVRSLNSINVFARKNIAPKGCDWIKKFSFQDRKKENTPKFPSMEI